MWIFVDHRWIGWSSFNHLWNYQTLSWTRNRAASSWERTWWTHCCLQRSRSCKLTIEIARIKSNLNNNLHCRAAKLKSNVLNDWHPSTTNSVMRPNVVLPRKMRKSNPSGKYLEFFIVAGFDMHFRKSNAEDETMFVEAKRITQLEYYINFFVVIHSHSWFICHQQQKCNANTKLKCS